MTTSYFYDKVLSPIYDKLTCWLWPDWVHPNFITFLGGMCAWLAGMAIERNYIGWACIFFTAYHMCDNMDGKHARRTLQTSRFGQFLDHAVDGLVGNYVGVNTITQVLCGVSIGSLEYWTGLHAWCCLWLAPHVVYHYSHKLDLGTRYFGIDEAFWTCSGILGIGSIWKIPLFLFQHGPQVIACLHYAAILHVVFHVVKYSFLQQGKQPLSSSPSRIPKKYLVLALYVVFWSMGGPRSSHITGYQFYMYWIPTLTFIVWNE